MVAFFGRAMSAVGQAGAAIANGFTATFTQVRNSTVETFSAIGSALAHGEFALAGEIAWASIKLAFAQGIAWVTNTWTEFTTGLAMIWDNVVTSIRQVWNNVISWIAKAILRLAETEQRLAELRAARQEAIARAQELEDGQAKDSPLAAAMAELEAALGQ